jgi:flagellar basal body L-ring protein FlgH
MLADQFQEAKDRAEAAELEAKEARQTRDELKQLLIDAMLEEETDSIGRNGRRYSLQAKAKYSKRSGMDQELFAALRADGLGDIITETVNANTLSATMRELSEENGGTLPEEYEDCINVYEYTDISVRKG